MSEHDETTPPYLCQSFGLTDPDDEPRMQQWLNDQADLGYRLADRLVSGSGVAKRIHVVMELPPPTAPEPAPAEGGA